MLVVFWVAVDPSWLTVECCAVELRTQELRKQADEAVATLNCDLRSYLQQVPRRVREMTLQQFQHEYGRSIPETVLSDMALYCNAAPADSSLPYTPHQGKGSSTPADNATPSHTVVRNAAGAVAQSTRRRGALRQELPGPSPAAATCADGPASSAGKRKARMQGFDDTPKTPKTPGTIAATPGTANRLPNRGEPVVSQNGSPLGTYEEGDESGTGATFVPQEVRLESGGSLRVITGDGKEVAFSQEGESGDDYSNQLGFLQSIQWSVSNMINRLTGATTTQTDNHDNIPTHTAVDAA